MIAQRRLIKKLRPYRLDGGYDQGAVQKLVPLLAGSFRDQQTAMAGGALQWLVVMVGGPVKGAYRIIGT